MRFPSSSTAKRRLDGISIRFCRKEVSGPEILGREWISFVMVRDSAEEYGLAVVIVVANSTDCPRAACSSGVTKDPDPPFIITPNDSGFGLGVHNLFRELCAV